MNGIYEPVNCRWATKKQQSNNSKKNIYLEIEGETRTLAEWSEISKIPYITVYNRVVKLKWEYKKAVFGKLNNTKNFMYA